MLITFIITKRFAFYNTKSPAAKNLFFEIELTKQMARYIIISYIAMKKKSNYQGRLKESFGS